jgi:hypothetical protein|tara:strand:+ start:98 stop:319 length:222 start_codon:yes stop_codon:yes gene_type:complete
MTQIKVDKQTLQHFRVYLEVQKSVMEGAMDGDEINTNTQYYGWYEATKHYIKVIEKAEQNPNYSFAYGDLTDW